MVQTELTTFSEVAVQAGTARPPPIPPEDLRRKSRRASLRKSRKGLLQNFKGTPRDTLEMMLMENLRSMNPFGRGCCPVHVSIHMLKEVMNQFSLSGNDASLSGNDGGDDAA